jgi:hypothetical protein
VQLAREQALARWLGQEERVQPGTVQTGQPGQTQEQPSP